jgi:hypothetical protein
MYFFSQIDVDSKVPLINVKKWIEEYTSYHILAIEHAKNENSLSCSLLFKSCSLTRTDKYTESLHKTLDVKFLKRSLSAKPKSPSPSCQKKIKIVTKILKNWKIFYSNYLKKKINDVKFEIISFNGFLKNEITKIFDDLEAEVVFNNIFSPNDMSFICQNCNKKYIYKNSFIKHEKDCKIQNDNETMTTINNNNDFGVNPNLEMEMLRKELEIERLRNELFKKDLEISKLENKNLKLEVNNITNNNTNTNNIINNNVNITKTQYLNLNFSNVIDINTFIENYKDKYGLTTEQTKILLENSQNDGINGCVSALVYYLKKSAVQQYKELKGADLEIDNVILPFLLSDKSLREHFEKSINGKWDKTTMIDNIKRIVTITNSQVFKHHNRFIDFNGPQRKRIVNGILKASAYSIISNISNPDFYRINTLSENSNEETKKNETSNTSNKCCENINNNDDLNLINNPDDEEEEDDDEEDYEEDYEEDEDDYEDYDDVEEEDDETCEDTCDDNLDNDELDFIEDKEEL